MLPPISCSGTRLSALPSNIKSNVREQNGSEIFTEACQAERSRLSILLQLLRLVTPPVPNNLPDITNMVFLSICTALYDYAPQGDSELALQEGELVYVLEKSSEDDWWKAKKRAPSEDEEEPVGLIPNNYVTEVSAAR